MTISKDLLLSILAMDSYNQGYDRGLEHDETQIGAASFYKEDISAEAEAASFYAVAYDTGDEIVISYRGTDNPGQELAGVDLQLAGFDNFNQTQVHLASQFLLSVSEQNTGNKKIVLTGHSLGGALAGITGLIHNKDIVSVDPIDFVPAGENFKLLITRYLEIKDTPNADEDLIDLNDMSIAGPGVDRFLFNTVEFAEEQLQKFGLGSLSDAELQQMLDSFKTITSASQDGYKSFYLSGSVAYQARDNDQTFSEAVLENELPSFGLTVGTLDAHSASLNSIIKFVENEFEQTGPEYLSFASVADEIFDALFSDQIADTIVQDALLGPSGSKNAALRDAIAYSALEDGGLVFGNTGIRAMFNDANELGRVYNISFNGSRNSLLNDDLDDGIFSDTSIKQAISNVVVQYAGALAVNKIAQDLSDNDPSLDILSGIINLDNDYSVLTVDYSTELWDNVLGIENPVDPLYREAFLSKFGDLAEIADFDALLVELADTLWGASDNSIYDRFQISTGLAGSDYVTLSERRYGLSEEDQTTVEVFVGNRNSETNVLGSDDHELLIGGDYDDHLDGKGGSNALFGGSGSDVLEVADGDKNYLHGGSDTYFENIEDIAKFSSGVVYDDEGNEVAARQGIKLDGIGQSVAGGSHALEIERLDLSTGKRSTDTLVNVESIELTHNKDILEVNEETLDADIKVDLGDSRRLQSEVDRLNATLGEDEEPFVLEDDAFQQNVDIVDYSNLSTGIKFAVGKTADHKDGLLTGGPTQLNVDLDSELNLLSGISKDQHGLVTDNADKIILTDHDDVLIAAELGTIVDLGGGEDKVWFQPGLLIQNFGLDDRLTLFGTVNVYGASRNVTSDSEWAYGNFGMRYAINTEGDMVVSNIFAGYFYGASDMFIEDWSSSIGMYNSGIAGHGAGDIILQEVSFETKRLFEIRPEDDIRSTWDYFVTKVRQLGGSPEKRDTVSDPLVLDLDGDGIELTSQTSSSGRFDTDYDGYNERTAFADSDDGMLARDINGNGVIDDGGELFGHDDVYGFDILKTLDGTGDGVVNADDNGLVDFNGDGVIDSDDEFSDLLVWQDINGNLVSEEFELKSVTDHGITAINLPDAEGDVQFDENGNPTFINSVDGNEIIGRTTFEREDGSTSELAEVLLKIDNIDTEYNGEDILISTEADALPDLSGQGTLVDLKKAMSFLIDPNDAAQVQALQDKQDIVNAAIGTFTSPDVSDLAENIRPVAHAWALASPILNDAGDVVNELEYLGDLNAFRDADGNLVDYIWGGEQSVVVDPDDGGDIIVTTLNFVSGSKLTHSYKVGSVTSSAISSWEDLRDLYLGQTSYELLEIGAVDPNGGLVGEDDLVGVDGGQIYWIGRTTNSAIVERNEIDGAANSLLINPNPNSNLELVDGKDISFIARYLGLELEAFYQEPKSSDGLETLQILLDTFDTTFKKLGVQFAVQQGPLSHHFENISYDVDIDKFVSTDEERELGGVFESIISESALKGEPIEWLAEWSDLLDHFIGGYSRQGGSTLNSNPFITQQFVNGFESANTGLDFMQVAGALGLRDDIILNGDGIIEGTSSLDIIYVSGDETEINSAAGDDAIIFGQTINDITINDFKSLGSNGFNQLRFAFHNADEFELSRDEENLYVTEISTGKIITVTKQFLGETPSLFGGNVAEQWGISQIVFADGTVWDEPQIVIAAANHDAGDSTEIGTNDNDYFDSGTGNDILIGGSDADIYYFEVGDGNDTISDSDSNPNKPFQDSIYFGSDLSANDLEFVRDGNSDDLLIKYGNQGDTIKIEGQFDKIHTGVFGSYFTDSIEYLHFSDGSAFTEDSIMSTILREASTENDDLIYGFDNDDIFINGLGNDIFIGGNGNDTYVVDLR